MDQINEFMKRVQQERIEKIIYLNRYAKKGEILFTGSSLMEQFPIEEFMMSSGLNKVIYNRGVGGYTTTDMLGHLEEMVFGTEPSKIFINIGSNDIGGLDFTSEHLIDNYEKILLQIKQRLPEAEVFLMAYYPVNEVDKIPEGEWGKIAFVNRNNNNLNKINIEVEKLANKMGYQFINVNKDLTDESGRLKREFTIEGIHMYANAYQVIFKNLMPYLCH